MVVFAGQGDARRSMALLWHATGPAAAHNGPGPKPGLSVEAIVAAAVEVADADGMGALSMRAVGERLGRTAMALYTYVPGKSELLDLMYDTVHAELPAAGNGNPESGSKAESGSAPASDPDSDGWRADLTGWAQNTLDFYVRHPWVLQISQARPVLGPHEYAGLDTLVRLLYGTGLDAHVLRGLTGTLFHFVRGSARTVADSRQAEAATGSSDQEWWSARSALLGEMAPDFADRFPHVVRLEREGRPEPFPDDAQAPYLEREARKTFAVGLGVLLDGIATAVTARAGHAGHVGLDEPREGQAERAGRG